MNSFPDSLNDLIDEFSRFPGIGRKTAQRMAFYVLNSNDNLANDLSNSILTLKSKIRFCEKCYGISEDKLCMICSNPRRDSSTICVVENPADIYTFEKTSIFKGLYHVLGGVLSPLDGIGPDQLEIKSLLERVEPENEVLVATNATIEGEATCLYLANLLEERAVKVTRLARGLPMGGDLEFVDDATIMRAIEDRSAI
ncbi:MAG: recombination protein RecR [Candidatus Marinimicrobia bacterium]|nr:recombination protein RecR [Candidatus Neomarinimicrobiota bacterium]MBO70408.1 recombination protein RecR [Candidatus Neomarinimicrobiota bacterium]MEC8703817.1 recombination mediator RecR [Candidatus Neomarinimicrobiota bacterium]MEC8705848.1 recombination mediator RecR [Candidatus Neomarinimicrobiota bacterium]